MTSSTSSGPPPAGTVVVGIDGSPGGDLAFDWAVRHAVLEHRPLTVLHSAHLEVSGTASLAGLPGGGLPSILQDLRVAGLELLANAVRRAGLLAPDLEVHTYLADDDARGALLRLGEHAAAVVLGSRGQGAFASLLLGSVSVTVSKHAACPVVVVRHDRSAASGHGVLVGVDGSEATLPAVEFAYRMASSLSAPLTAMHVFWNHPATRGPDRAGVHHEVGDEKTGLDTLRALLSESVAGMREKFPEVEARVALVRGYRDRELIAASRSRELVVVGSRHRGFVNELVHGAVASTVVEHALCNVAVIPAAVAHRS